MSRLQFAVGQTIAVWVLMWMFGGQVASASTLRERLAQRHAIGGQVDSLVLPAGARVMHDVAWGRDPHQRFDVYVPARAHHAPVIFMVHGGGWRRGDKAAAGVIQNKITRWVPRGFIVISTNYRLLPGTPPLQQAQDVARALAVAQQQAAKWGGDASRFILMGHSAGAHLVALLTAERALASRQGARPWLGTVSLDSASLDVVQIMQGRHLHLYDEAFGTSAADWLTVSPYQQMHGRIVPFLAVCSSRRRDSCPQAHAFARKAESLRSHARVLEEDLRHGEIDSQLGLPSDYTTAVEQFMRSLDPVVAQHLG
ncbi:MAG TPA: alpha/beta hydrolase [Rhodanobacter sp.]|nr:alpha/beta hydrolase [Rhodanobacter sp.]